MSFRDSIAHACSTSRNHNKHAAATIACTIAHPLSHTRSTINIIIRGKVTRTRASPYDNTDDDGRRTNNTHQQPAQSHMICFFSTHTHIGADADAGSVCACYTPTHIPHSHAQTPKLDNNTDAAHSHTWIYIYIYRERGRRTPKSTQYAVAAAAVLYSKSIYTPALRAPPMDRRSNPSFYIYMPENDTQTGALKCPTSPVCVCVCRSVCVCRFESAPGQK